jgi:hypothetical protein
MELYMRLCMLMAGLLLLGGCDRETASPSNRGDAAATAASRPKKIVPGVRVQTAALPEHLKAVPAVPAAASPTFAAAPPSPAVEAIRAKLEQAGFGSLAGSDWSDIDEDPVRPESVLRAAGLLVWFDVETGSFPNQHDGLLRELAAAAAGDLSGVVFEEIPPDDDDTGGRYVLNAYADGKRWSANAENYGDWYDVDAMLRLGNALLRDRGSDRRMLLLVSEDQTAEVIVAPRAALGAALRGGLLYAGDPAVAREAGQAFEAGVGQKR